MISAIALFAWISYGKWFQEWTRSAKKKKNLEDEVKTLKNLLQSELQLKVECVKNVLMLKRTKKHLENDIKNIEKTKEVLLGLNSERIDHNVFEDITRKIENLALETENLKDCKLSAHLEIEKIWKNKIEKCKNEHQCELDRFSQKKQELQDKIFKSKGLISELSQKISDEKLKNLSLQKDLDLSKEKLKKIQETYEKTNVEQKIKLYEVNSKLHKEQETTLEITKEINELENKNY